MFTLRGDKKGVGRVIALVECVEQWTPGRPLLLREKSVCTCVLTDCSFYYESFCYEAVHLSRPKAVAIVQLRRSGLTTLSSLDFKR